MPYILNVSDAQTRFCSTRKRLIRPNHHSVANINRTCFSFQILGRALGIPENSVKTYTEAEIRAG